MRESWERYRCSYMGVTIRTRSESPIGTDPCVASRRTGSENVLVQNLPSFSSRIDHPLFPGFATGPLTDAAQCLSVGVTGHRIDSIRKHQGSEKKLICRFRKVPELLHGGNNQNSLEVPDRNQIVRDFKKNVLRSAQFRNSDTGVDHAPCPDL